ncbi:hypothetical protein POPTR_001G367100v4 [Populus trichocarpa]|jgi:hypothetical protein|uniref:Transmembrane protein n=3 Tax=Populus TaxID=3689 RepID=A9PCY5_POPTR|nr:uncharacterized protein LOC7487540 [Populus trichocarpa]ABK94238.1 unknown [Populus trichocarpa]KAH8518972.1 hypothetical protein H0E87_000709 [Populus deltoides]KAI5605041.1 hypothetical protein BDE02_01G325200 [Populus trichocarpa]PNT58687.1 hypothetical protein POPTR_001G367100v4 [Populus trichocarpa]|eukprot:XP_002300378.1 uncharacterized protein LOC7487540 [Populus trichocarpa]
MGNTPESQISSQYFFKPSLLCVSVLVASLVFTCFLLFGISTYLITISVLFLSTIFIVTFSKKKVAVVSNSAEAESPTCRPQSMLEKEVVEELNPEVEPIIHCDASQQSDVCDMHEYQVEPTDFPSDSDSSDDFSASENFELSWRCSENVGQSIAVSESSISENDVDEDGDGLIEISLPLNNSVDFDEESKKKSVSNLPESIFRQQGLMELFAEIAEVNEEENLIEIDLSMGSIKC